MPLKKVYKRFLGERIHASRVIVVGGCGFLMVPRLLDGPVGAGM